MFELTAEAIIFLLRLALVGLLYLFLGAIALTSARELRRLSRAAPAGPSVASGARLVVVSPGGTSLPMGAALALRPVTRLGRAAESTILLDDTYISAEHAVIVQREGGWWLLDRGSTNGTSVNGRGVHNEVGLTDGDIVEIGDVRLRVSV